jgi:hypothetical protein
MNEIVGELVALAGGAGRHMTSSRQDSPGQGGRLGQSDHILHHIANKRSKQVSSAEHAKVAPEKAIPLGPKEDDVERFNT